MTAKQAMFRAVKGALRISWVGFFLVVSSLNEAFDLFFGPREDDLSDGNPQDDKEECDAKAYEA